MQHLYHQQYNAAASTAASQSPLAGMTTSNGPSSRNSDLNVSAFLARNGDASVSAGGSLGVGIAGFADRRHGDNLSSSGMRTEAAVEVEVRERERVHRDNDEITDSVGAAFRGDVSFGQNSIESDTAREVEDEDEGVGTHNATNTTTSSGGYGDYSTGEFDEEVARVLCSVVLIYSVLSRLTLFLVTLLLLFMYNF